MYREAGRTRGDDEKDEIVLREERGLFATKRLVLSIEAGEVVVRLDSKERGRIPLEELAQVALDSFTTRTVMERPNLVPGISFSQGMTGPEVDRARVALVTREGRRLLLDDAFVAHMLASETFREVRLFLRKHGWLPIDEREDGAAG